MKEAMILVIEARLEGVVANPQAQANVLGATVVRVAEDVYLLPQLGRGELTLAQAARRIAGVA
jgi:hypothetical protein